ncbi:MAG: hypothetical protein ABFD52_04955 [Acidobacteriota bacterium]
MGDIKFTVTIDDKGSATIKKLEEGVRGLGQSGAGAGKSVGFLKGAISSMAGQFVTAIGITSIFSKVISEVERFFADSINEAAEYEKALKGLNTAFAISGRTMPGMVKNLQGYADSLQAAGLETDDNILKAESLLLQLTNLDEQGIKAATRGAIGLAAVFTMDLQGAAEMVAKAMSGNYRAIGQLVPAIRNATTESAKHAELMKALEGFYSRAVADTETYAGKVKRLGLEWKEAKKSFGEAILSTGVLQDVITSLADEIKRLSGNLGRELKDAAEQTIDANNRAGESLAKMADAIGWNRQEITLLRIQYGLSSAQLVEWIKSNMLGKAAAAALAKILAQEAEEAERAKRGFSETGAAANQLAKWLEDLGIKGGDELRGQLELAIKALAEMRRITPGDTGVIQALQEKIKELRVQLYGATKDIYVAMQAAALGRTKLPEPIPFTQKAAEAELPKPITTGPIVQEAMKIAAANAEAARSATELSQVWNQAIGNMISQSISWGDSTGSIFKSVGSIFKNFVKETVTGLELMAVVEIKNAITVGKAEKMKALARHIANIFAKLPFPLDLIAAAGAFAAINALFAKVLKFREGGVFDRPTIAEIGHGTEYVLPEAKLIKLVQQAMAGAGRIGAPAAAGMIFNFNIRALDGSDVLSVTRRQIVPLLQRHLDHNKGAL